MSLSSGPPRLWYVVAVAAPLAAILVRLILRPLLGSDVPYLTFFAAVMVSAWYGGVKPGLLATALSGVASIFLFLIPAARAHGLRLGEVVALLLFAAIGWLISAMSERLHHARKGQRFEAERLRTTLQSIGDGVIVTDATGRVDTLNPVAERLTGWTSAEASGRDLPEVFHIVDEETRTSVENPALRALAQLTATGVSQHALLLSKDGDERPIDDTAAPVRRDDGTVSGTVLVFRDVSERRRANDALRRSEQELSDFFNNATIALHWVGPDGIILRANQAELDMLGYSAEEYLGRHIAEFHTDQAVIADILRRLTAGEDLHNYPARLRCRDGGVKHVLISSSVRWDRGRFVHTRCFTLDVTDRKRAEEMKGLLAAVVESSEDAVISKTIDGRILSWNAGAQAMFGYAAEEAIGRPITLIIPPDLHAMEQDILARVGGGERIETFETTRQSRAGQRLDVSLTLSPVRDETGAIVAASSIARDIRRRKALEQSLRDADRRKDEFLALLAHELRNPLAPIRNSVAAAGTGGARRSGSPARLRCHRTADAQHGAHAG